MTCAGTRSKRRKPRPKKKRVLRRPAIARPSFHAHRTCWLPWSSYGQDMLEVKRACMVEVIVAAALLNLPAYIRTASDWIKWPDVPLGRTEVRCTLKRAPLRCADCIWVRHIADKWCSRVFR